MPIMRLFGASACLTVECGHLYTPFPGSVDNLTTDNLTCFFAAQGVAKEEANNMYEYTYWWLTTAAATQLSQAGEIHPFLDQVNPAISEAGGRPPMLLLVNNGGNHSFCNLTSC